LAIFKDNKLILLNGDFLRAGEIMALRFEQINRTAMRNNPEDKNILKNY